MIKDLEKIIFGFLWNKKSEKVARKVTYLPVKKGGLGMVDLKSFWSALKFSWYRRLTNSEAFWVRILETELAYHNHKLDDLTFLGPSELVSISKKLANPFWVDALRIASNMIKSLSYAAPNKIMLFPIFRNPLFKIGKTNVGQRTILIDKISVTVNF